MSKTEELADDLARDAIKYIDKTGDEDIVAEMARVLGATSQTAEEAFRAAVRVRQANNKARKLLQERQDQYDQQGTAPDDSQ